MTALAIASTTTRARPRAVDRVVEQALKDARDRAWMKKQLKAGERGVIALIRIARNWDAGFKVSRLYPGKSLVDVIHDHIGYVSYHSIDVLLTETTLTEKELALLADANPGTIRRHLEQLVHDGKAVHRKLPTPRELALPGLGKTSVERLDEMTNDLIANAKEVFPNKRVPAKSRDEAAAMYERLMKELAFMAPH